jgi:pilus assembly protein CpaF
VTGQPGFENEPFPGSPELDGSDPFADGWGSEPGPGSPFAAQPTGAGFSDAGYGAAEPGGFDPVQQTDPYQVAAVPGDVAADPYAGYGAGPQDAQPVMIEQVAAAGVYEPEVEASSTYAQVPGTGYGTPASLDGLPPHVAQSVQALLARIGDDDCTEVICNGPAEVVIKIKGQRYHDPQINFGDADTYHECLNNFVLPYVDTRDRIDGRNPLVEGQMELPPMADGEPPTLARVHILAPPLVSCAKATIAKKAKYALLLDDITASGAMSPEMADFLKSIAHARLTFIVAGVTGAGKTTLLQAMAHEFDTNDRIVVVEDTPELRLPIADVVYLTSTTIKPGMDVRHAISIEWLVKQTQRMRMDRVIVGEVRGSEMYEFLVAANSGANGSTTTIHAESPRRALDKMLALSAKGAGNVNEMTLRREISATVDIVVQASLIEGRHVITAIEEVSSTPGQNGVFSTSTLMRYDITRGVHVVENPPSGDLQERLKTAGVPVNPAWFPSQGRRY